MSLQLLNCVNHMLQLTLLNLKNTMLTEKKKSLENKLKDSKELLHRLSSDNIYEKLVFGSRIGF